MIYKHNGFIHNDPKHISGYMANVGVAACRRTIEDLMACDPPKLDLIDGKLSNRVAREKLKVGEFSGKNEKNLKKNGPNMEDEPSENNNLASPNITEHIEREKMEQKSPNLFGDEMPSDVPPDLQKQFDQFWSVYPAGSRKTGKANARSLFLRIIQGKHSTIERDDAENIIEGAKTYGILMGPNNQYQKGVVAWLNNEYWRAPNGGAPKFENDNGPMGLS